VCTVLHKGIVEGVVAAPVSRCDAHVGLALRELCQPQEDHLRPPAAMRGGSGQREARKHTGELARTVTMNATTITTRKQARNPREKLTYVCVREVPGAQRRAAGAVTGARSPFVF